MSQLIFPIERERSLHVLGLFLTGLLPGRILTAALFMIGILFMGNLGFSPISIIFFIVFIGPMTILLYRRMVIKGRNLMKYDCFIEVHDDLLIYKSGYPNTLNPELQEIKLVETNRDIAVIGEELSGYQLLLVEHPGRIRFGLWRNNDDALQAAKQLLELTGGKLVDDPKKSKTQVS